MIQSQSSEIDKDFYIWLAGFIDGEGCFQLSKHKHNSSKQGFYWMVIISISQSNKQFLYQLKNDVGFGSVAGHAPYAKLNFSINQIDKLLPLILPYLRVKKEEALFMKKIVRFLIDTRRKKTEHDHQTLEKMEKKLKLLKPRNQYPKPWHQRGKKSIIIQNKKIMGKSP